MFNGVTREYSDSVIIGNIFLQLIHKWGDLQKNYDLLSFLLFQDGYDENNYDAMNHPGKRSHSEMEGRGHHKNDNHHAGRHDGWHPGRGRGGEFGRGRFGRGGRGDFRGNHGGRGRGRGRGGWDQGNRARGRGRGRFNGRGRF